MTICKMTFPFFVVTALGIIPTTASSPEIDVVSIILGGNPAYEYKLSAPTYRLAFQAAQSAFANFTFREISFVERGISKSCDDEEHLAFDSASQIFEILYQLRGPAVIQTPGCTDVALLLGDFAREFNLPILLSTAGDPAFLNKQRYPAALNFGPADHGSLADGAKQFLQLYKWSTISLLCGTKYASVKPFESSTCENLYKTLDSKSSPGQFDVYRAFFNPEISSEHRFHLLQSKLRSRIIVLCLDASFIRSIMAEAADLSMTNGDYVILSVQSNVLKNQLDRIWNKKDSNNSQMIQAFRTLIVYANKGPDWDAISELVGGINTNVNLDSKGNGSRTGSPSIPVNSLNIAAYEAFMVMASVLRENSAITKQYLATKPRSSELTLNFVKQFWNRHFSLSSGVVNLDIRGYRRTNTIFLRFNSDTQHFEEGWFFDVSANLLTSVSNISGIWPNRTGPPPNHPKCGYANNECYDESGQRILLIGCLTAVSGILLMVLGVAYGIRWFHFYVNKRSAWWLLDPISFLPALDLHAKVSTSSKAAAKVAETQSNAAKGARSKQYPKGNLYNIRTYKNALVVLDSFPWVHNGLRIPSQRKIVMMINNIKGLLHVNVGTFLGTLVCNDTAATVWECEPRGPLRFFLDAEDAYQDISMKLSLCWDVIAGVAYLHRSNVQFHGSLSSFACWIDQRLTVKLVFAGSRYLLNDIFHISKRRQQNNLHSSGYTVQDLWQPPETCTNHCVPGSKFGDIFGLGVLIGEILTGQGPLGIQYWKYSNIYEVLSKTDAEQLSSLSPLSRIDLSKSALHPTVITLLQTCWSEKPQQRPIIRNFMDRFHRFYPRKGLLNGIVHRLEIYAEELERRVADRTEELISETHNVDRLLSMMIPESLVAVLRNKGHVLPEIFESATVLFSEVQNFAEISRENKPLSVVVFLDTLYLTLDALLERRDVYKVETIKDSYMVVSGLPQRNNGRHVFEIVCLSVEFIKATSEMKNTSHHAYSVMDYQLRIGFHSGPCVAGIVGLRMPRYCVFGDTVNTASRMQAYGEGGRILTTKFAKDLLMDYSGFALQERGTLDIKPIIRTLERKRPVGSASKYEGKGTSCDVLGNGDITIIFLAYIFLSFLDCTCCSTRT